MSNLEFSLHSPLNEIVRVGDTVGGAGDNGEGGAAADHQAQIIN